MLRIKMGFTWILSIIFMILKLCGVISWKWVWVFSPVWVTILIGCAISLVYSIVKLLRK